MKEIYKLRSFLRPYWKESAWSLVVLTLVVVMDLAIPRLVQRIIDDGIYAGQMGVVLNTTIVMLVLSVLSTIFALMNNYFSVKAGEGLALDLREALFMKVHTLSFGNLDRLQTGQLMVRLTSDVLMIQRVIRMSLRIGTRAPLLMLGSLVLMFITDFKLALTLFPLLVVTGYVGIWFIARLGPLYLKVQQKLDALNTVLQENIAGVRVVQAFMRMAHENQRFQKANRDFTEENVVVTQYNSMLFPALTSLVNLGIVIVIWMGGVQAVNGEVSVGEIVAFTNYLLTTMGPLLLMAMLATVVASGEASAERINEVFATEPEIVLAETPTALPEPLRGRVVFENVHFHYNGAVDEPVLKGINLTAEPGQTVAILGATGSGKTTLVNLIPRFYDVTAGRVTIDGVDVRDLDQESLRSIIGIAMQEAVLFSGPVKENIRFGKPQATDEEVVAAAKAAQAHEFIMELPEGYDTRVEQRGVNLSGGQKQRISIARALLTQPKILILDDTTSAVDVETETKIQNALDVLMRGVTSFVIAQRISTVLNADKIVVIEDGRIAAEGTHRELLAASPIYQEIYDSQLGAGIDIHALTGEV